MCLDPMSMMMMAGAGLSAVGSIMQGQMAYQAAKAQNAAYQQQADAEAAASALEVAQRKRQQELAMSAAIAQVGSSGVGLRGSPTTVLSEQAGEHELDLQVIKYGSQLRQQQLRNQGALALWQGKQQRMAGIINAGGSIFSGATSLYDRGIRFTNPFARRTSITSDLYG